MSEPIDIARREKEMADNPDVTFTGQTIKDAKPKSLKSFRDDIVEAAVLSAGTLTGKDSVKVAVDAYHKALRQADREVK